MTTLLTCERCGAELGEEVGGASKCPKCKGELAQLFQDLHNPTSRVIEEESAYALSSGADEESTENFPLAAAGAFGGALLGAVLWAAIVWVANYEIGFVAWAIGGMVGFGAVKLGGRGTTMALTAAGLVLFSIFAGKLFGTQLALKGQLDQVREESFSEAHFRELQLDAIAFAELPTRATDEELKGFMVAQNFTQSTTTDTISPEELAWFREAWVDDLEAFGRDKPRYPEWEEASYAAFHAGFMSDFSLTSAILEELNHIDLIFALLGVTTAFGMVKRRRTAPARG